MSNIQQGGPQASRGFTLIEMSIVLVIIGLIVGGILKGQEIVNSAREKSVINQINAVRSAQGTYFDRHNALPGDDKKGSFINAQIANGDGNGYVATTGQIAANAKATAAQVVLNSKDHTKEEFNYFVALLSESLIGNGAIQKTAADVTGFGIDNGSVLPNTSFPAAGLGITAGIHAGDVATDPSSAILTGTNWLGIWSFANQANGGVSLRQAGHIDTAMDDGLPDQGLVRGDDDKCNVALATGYNGGTDLANPTCILLINMGTR